MLLLPFRDNASARSVPVVTIAIAIVCAIVLFAFQSQDASRDERAFRYYRESGLDRLELPRYQAYLAERTDPDAAERLHRLQHAPATGAAAVQLLQGDARFVTDLHERRVIREEDPDFASWSSLRGRFEEMLDATVHAHYALSRAHAGDLWRYLSYAFLHGGTAHWLGNMLSLIHI